MEDRQPTAKEQEELDLHIHLQVIQQQNEEYELFRQILEDEREESINQKS
jgi:hypothetical protein